MVMEVETMMEPKSKRAKISDDEYMPGSITKIQLSNFMTFTSLTCKPSPRLNLVIGPNGSGKSSLVCAIALALCGNPRLLGRATHIKDYVRRGQESGFVSLSLQEGGGGAGGDGDNDNDDDHTVTITRRFDVRNKSEWLVNGELVTKEKVQELVRRLGIQIDNLTQFLPQDRVCEFAKLSHVELLRETEKSVGDGMLHVQHCELVAKSGEMKRLRRGVDSHDASLGQLKDMNAGLEKDVERVRQREGLLENAEMMKKKLRWCEYDARKAEFVEAEKREKDARVKVDGARDAFKKIRDSIDEIKGKRKEQNSKFQEMNGLLDTNKTRCSKLVEDDSFLAVQIRGKYKEIDDLKYEDVSRQERICKAKEDLAAAETELSELPAIQIPNCKVQQLHTRYLELENAAKEMIREKEQLQRELHRHQTELRGFENATNEKLRALRRLKGTDGIYEAYQFVKDHQSEFRREIYGPVFLEISILNQAYAHYLEGQVPGYVWKAFLTQDSSDRDLLYESLKKFKVPIINFAQERPRYRDQFRPSPEMLGFDITARLDQGVFEAPDAVKEFLIDSYNLDSAYIGSQNTALKADLVQARLGITNLWTPENHYVWKKSRYSNYISASVDGVDDSNTLFSSSSNREFEKAKVRELEEKISYLKARVEELGIASRRKRDEAALIKNDISKIYSVAQSDRKKLKDMESRVRWRRKNLETLEMKDDTDSAKAKLVEQVKSLKVRRFHCALQLKNLLVEAVDFYMRLAEIRLCCCEFEAKIKDMASSATEHENSINKASRNLTQCEREAKRCKQIMSDAKRNAESTCRLTPELEHSFREMPTSVVDLKAAIQDALSKANSIMFLNPSILEQYEKRQKEILELEIKLETDKRELNNLVNEINSLKESWLPKLKSIVEQINETFGRNFQELAVAGEVCLDEHGMDFDQYGILLKVKFRQSGQLKVLDSNHQSGGERSVSTMAYLVALQHITNCPFRVVDEINQGMDQINERKMFGQLVRSASREKTPQCFLITPKLLPDLPYNDSCTILNVMNGARISEDVASSWSHGGGNWRSVVRRPVQENHA